MNSHQNDFMVFMLDEYHYNHEYGSVISDHHKSLVKLLDDSTIVDNITRDDRLNIISRELCDDLLTTIKNNVYLDLFDLPLSPSAMLEKLTSIVSTDTITIIPFTRSQHAMTIFIRRSGTYYDTYFCNSGLGSEHQRYKADQKLLTDSIIKNRVTKRVLLYALMFIYLSDSVQDVYGTALNILQANNIYADQNEYLENKGCRVITNQLNSDLTYFEPQKVGSCSFRSIMFHVYIYLCIINTVSVERYEELVNYLRYCLVKSYTKDIIDNSKIDRIRSDAGENTVYNYIQDIYRSKVRYTDNEVIKNILRSIDADFETINNQIRVTNKQEETSYDILKRSNLAMKIVRDTSVPLKTEAVNKTVIYNSSIYDYLDEKRYINQFYRKYESFNVFESSAKDNQIDRFFDELDTTRFNPQEIARVLLFSTNRINIGTDIQNLINVLTSKIHIPSADELAQNIKKERVTLDCNLIMVYYIINLYCKRIAENVGLKDIKDYRYLNAILGHNIVSNIDSYRKFKNGIEQMLSRDKLYLDYIGPKSDVLLSTMFPGNLQELIKEENIEESKSVIDTYEQKLLTGVYYPTKILGRLVKTLAVDIVDSILDVDIIQQVNKKLQSTSRTFTYTLRSWIRINTDANVEDLNSVLTRNKNLDPNKQQVIRDQIAFMKIRMKDVVEMALEAYVEGVYNINKKMIEKNDFKYDFVNNVANEYDVVKFCHTSIYDKDTKVELVYNGYGIITSLDIFKQFIETCNRIYEGSYFVPVTIKSEYKSRPSEKTPEIPLFKIEPAKTAEVAPSALIAPSAPDGVAESWDDDGDSWDSEPLKGGYDTYRRYYKYALVGSGANDLNNKIPAQKQKQTIENILKYGQSSQTKTTLENEIITGFFDNLCNNKFIKLPSNFVKASTGKPLTEGEQITVDRITDSLEAIEADRQEINKLLSQYKVELSYKLIDIEVVSFVLNVCIDKVKEFISSLNNKTYNKKSFTTEAIKVRKAVIATYVDIIKGKQSEVKKQIEEEKPKEEIPPAPEIIDLMKNYMSETMTALTEPRVPRYNTDTKMYEVGKVAVTQDIIDSVMVNIALLLDEYTKETNFNFTYNLGDRVSLVDDGKEQRNKGDDMKKNKKKTVTDQYKADREAILASIAGISSSIGINILRICYANTFFNQYLQTKEHLATISTYIDNLIRTKLTLQTHVSTQYVLPSLCRDIISDPFGELPHVNLATNVFPNVHMIQGVAYHSENINRIVGEEYDYHNHVDKLESMFNDITEIQIKEFANVFTSLKETQDILEIEQKLYFILLYMFYKINIVPLNENMSQSLYDNYYHILNNINIYSKQKRYDKSYLMSSYLIDYLIFKRDLTNNRLEKIDDIVIKIISYDTTRFISLENDVVIVEEGVLYDIFTANAIHKNRFNKLIMEYYTNNAYLRDYVGDVYIEKLIDMFEWNKMSKSKIIDGKVVFTFGGEYIEITGRRVSSQYNSRDVFNRHGKIESKTKYIVSWRGRRILSPHEIIGLPSHFFDNSLITEDGDTFKISEYTPIIKNKDDHVYFKNLSFVVDVLNPETILKMKVEIDGVIYDVVPNTEGLYRSVLSNLSLTHFDLPDGYVIVRDTNTDSYKLVLTRSNTIVDIRPDGYSVNDIEMLNRHPSVAYVLGSQKNVIICGNPDNLDDLVMYQSTLYQNNRPVSIHSVSVDQNGMWSVLKSDTTIVKHPNTDSFNEVHNITNRVDRLALTIHDGHVYLSFDQEDNLDAAFRSYYGALGYSNYILAKSSMVYISKMMVMTQTVHYEDYIRGVFPFNKLLIESINLMKAERYDSYRILDLILINNQIPIDIRYKKGFFNTLNTDMINLTLQQKTISIVGPRYKKYGGSKNGFEYKILDAGMLINRNYKPLKLSNYIDTSDSIDSICLNFIGRIISKDVAQVFVFDQIVSPKDLFGYVFDMNPPKTSKLEKQPCRNINNEIRFQLIDSGRQLRWDVLVFRPEDDIKRFILPSDSIFNGIEEKNLSDDKDNKVVLPSHKTENIEDDISNYYDEFTRVTKRYTITDIGKFRQECGDALKELIVKIKTHLKERYSSKKIITTEEIIHNTDNVEMCEMIFYNTLILKYESDLTRLTDPAYRIEENIDIFMQILREYPGYLDLDGVTEVNTLVVFFDYVFSMNEHEKDKFKGGTVIRKKQYDLISNIIDKDCNIFTRNRFYQLIMGAGKSTYIAPLLSLLIISKGMYPIHCMPEYLIEQSVERMELLRYFGINNIRHTIGRQDVRSGIYSLDEIGGINTSSINFIMSDQSLKSLLLNNVQYGDIHVTQKLLHRLKRCFIVFDEVDDISDPYSCELNYPDSQTTVDVELLEDRFKLHTSILKYFYSYNIRELYNIKRFDFEVIRYDKEMKETSVIYVDRELSKEMIEQMYSARSDVFTKEINRFLGLHEKDAIDAKLWIDFADVKNLKALIEYDDLIDLTKRFIAKIDSDTDISTKYGEEKQMFIKRFELIRSMFHDCIPYCLVSRNRKDFGLIDVVGEDRSHKGNTVAIPFKALEDPNLKSEFSSIDITIALTVVAYMLNPYILRKGDYNIIFNDLYSVYRQMDAQQWNVSDSKSEYIELCNSILGFSLPAEIDIPDIHDFDTAIKFKNSYKGDKNPVSVETNIRLFDDMIQTSANRYMKQFKYQLNATFSDITNSDFCQNRTGFSGTPYFVAPRDRNSKKILEIDPIKDKQAEGQIYYSILDKRVEIYPVEAEPIKEVFKLLQTRKYYALIDVGAYFLGLTNDQVSKMLLDLDDVHHVLYLDKDDRQVIVSKKRTENGFTYTDPVPEKYVTIKPDEKLFVYYDQKHITGIDVKKMNLQAKGLVLLRYTNQLRDYSQGAFRLRKINVTQSVDIMIDRSLMKRAKISIEDSNEDKKYKLLVSLIKGQNNLTAQKTQMQALHNLRTICRFAFINNDIGRLEYSLEHDDMRRNIFMMRSSYDLPTKIDDIVKDPIQYVIRSLNSVTQKIVGIDQNIRLRDTIKWIEGHIRQILISRRMDSQQVSMNIMEEVVEEQQIEEEEEEDEEIFQQMMLHLRSMYDKFSDIPTSYPIEHVIDLVSIGKIDDHDANTKTFVSYGYDDLFLLSTLLISRYYSMPHEWIVTNRIEFQYRFIHNKKANKILIVLPEEHLHIRSIYDNVMKNTDVLDLNVKYSDLPIGAVSLLRYQLDIVSNMRDEQIAMIDRLITDHSKFKQYSYCYSKSDDPNTYKKFKIVDRTVLKLVLGKQFTDVSLTEEYIDDLITNLYSIIVTIPEKRQSVLDTFDVFTQILLRDRSNISTYIRLNTLRDVMTQDSNFKYARIISDLMKVYKQFLRDK